MKSLLVECDNLCTKLLDGSMRTMPFIEYEGIVSNHEAVLAAQSKNPDLMIFGQHIFDMWLTGQRPLIEDLKSSIHLVVLTTGTFQFPPNRKNVHYFDVNHGIDMFKKFLFHLYKLLNRTLGGRIEWESAAGSSDRLLGNQNNSEIQKEVLSVREVQVLTYISKGLTNKEIAEELFVSPLTVKTHRQNILSKLHVQNAAAAVDLSSKLGLI